VFLFVAACLLGAFFLVPVRAHGADPDRERNARVALALASSAEKKDHDRNARVALAFSEHAAVIYVAPPPKAKSKPGCSCGDDCKCKPGQCPACPALKKEIARLRDSLVRVRTSAGSGSGTVVWSADGKSLVLTAYHVTEKGTALEVRAEGKWHPAQILASDQAGDVVALVVSAELPAVAVAEEDPREGAEVLMLGVTSLWSRGTLGKCDGPRCLIACAACADYSDSGDSGGGVFAGGKLVGVHCGKCGPNQQSVQTPYCAACKPVRSLMSKCFVRKDTLAALPVPKAMPAAAEFDLWIVNGRYVWVPKGQQPSSCPSCPNGRCPLQRP